MLQRKDLKSLGGRLAGGLGIVQPEFAGRPQRRRPWRRHPAGFARGATSAALCSAAEFPYRCRGRWPPARRRQPEYLGRPRRKAFSSRAVIFALAARELFEVTGGSLSPRLEGRRVLRLERNPGAPPGFWPATPGGRPVPYRRGGTGPGPGAARRRHWPAPQSGRPPGSSGAPPARGQSRSAAARPSAPRRRAPRPSSAPAATGRRRFRRSSRPSRAQSRTNRSGGANRNFHRSAGAGPASAPPAGGAVPRRRGRIALVFRGIRLRQQHLDKLPRRDDGGEGGREIRLGPQVIRNRVVRASAPDCVEERAEASNRPPPGWRKAERAAAATG